MLGQIQLLPHDEKFRKKFFKTLTDQEDVKQHDNDDSVSDLDKILKAKEQLNRMR